MPVDLVAVITATAGKEAEAGALLSTLAHSVKNDEPGVLRYKPYKRVGADGAPQFVVIERYADESVHEAHRETSHFKLAMKKGTEEGLLAGLEIYKIEPLDGGIE